MAASLRNVYIAFVAIALGGLLFGYCIGINSNVVTTGQLVCARDRSEAGGTWTSVGYDQCYDMGDWEQGILSSMNLIGATVSSLICFQFADGLGRKREVQIGAALYMLGSVAAAASPVKWGIFAGLLIYGLGIGFAMHAAPIYIAEIAPAEVRGMLVSAKEAVIVLGMFLGFAAGAGFGTIDGTGWRAMIGVAGAIGLAMEASITFIPNSPRWLVLQAVQRGGLLGADGAWMDEARASLQFFRSGSAPEEVEEELQAIRLDAQAAVGAGAQSSKPAFCATFRYPRPLVVGCGLVLLQQVTGQPSVLYFATNLFKGAGFASTAALSAVLVGFIKLLATLFTVFRVDQFGRKQLLTWGIALMILALGVLGVAFIFRRCSDTTVDIRDCAQDDITLPRPWAIATVVALMVYVSGYQVGFGPISWLMISEVFPLSIRGSALSTAAIVNFISNILMTLCQAVLMQALTPAGLYFAYLGLSVLSLLFVRFLVPETKGKTLEEIEREMTGRKPSARQPTMALAPMAG